MAAIVVTASISAAAAAAPAAAAPAPVTISVSLDQAAIRANGRAVANLGIEARVAGGAPLAGATITLSATWTTPTRPGSANFAPRLVVLDSNGRGTSRVTSTRSGTMLVTASIRTAAFQGSASRPLATLRRSIVVFVNGAGSLVTCSAPGVCGDSSGIFNPVRTALAARGFQPADLPTFSYAGGEIDPTTHAWMPNPSTCESTAVSLKTTIDSLRTMLRKIGSAQPNSDISVIGLSLGGTVAFQMVAALTTLPKGSRLANIITLNGAIGGLPTSLIQHLEPIAGIACWSAGGASPAAQQLNATWNTTAPNQGPRQADTATILCAVVGVTGCTAQTNKQALVAATPGLAVRTWGSSLDGVFDPTSCGFTGLPNALDTQVITGAGGGLHAEPTTTGSGCTLYSHIAVVASRAGEIAAAIGSQQ